MPKTFDPAWTWDSSQVIALLAVSETSMLTGSRQSLIMEQRNWAESAMAVVLDCQHLHPEHQQRFKLLKDTDAAAAVHVRLSVFHAVGRAEELEAEFGAGAGGREREAVDGGGG